MRRRLLPVLFLALALPSAVACASKDDTTDENAGAIQAAANGTPPWIYEGPLPGVTEPRIVTSIIGHTTRFTGVLSDDYDTSKLPAHATLKTRGDGKREITVVYPVATGKYIDKVRNKNGDALTPGYQGPTIPPGFNNVPGKYDHVNVRPYRPNDGSHGDASGWGGFPFINYHDARRFALHGPIDFGEDGVDGEHSESPTTDWHLTRGRISNGCNRMQGEHVLELTHLLGFNMRKPHTIAENKEDPKNGIPGKYMRIDLKVLPDGEWDTIDDGSGPQIVDVDYPRHSSAEAPPEGKAVKLFPTWDGNDKKEWACYVRGADATKPALFDGSYCKRVAGAR